MILLQGLCTAPSWRTCVLLACGWALASKPHTLTPSVGLTGAATLQHFSRFSGFLGCPCYHARWQVGACLMRHAAPRIPAEAPIVIACDDTPQTNAGTPSAGVARYRNGAGSARQDYRTRRGLNLVLGVMRVPLPLGPGHSVTVPIGLARSLTEEQARQHHRPQRSRSRLARASVDCVATPLPGRPIRARGDGGQATQDCLCALPDTVDVVSWLLRSGQLYALPEPPAGKRRGRPSRNGQRLGSPTTWACTRRGWQPQPMEAQAAVHPWVGLWQTVLPGRLVRVSVVRRRSATRPTQPRRRQPLPPVEACFTTDLSRSVEDIVRPYRDRWAVEITLRASHACDGLGQDQCRKLQRMVGAHTLRRVRAAARTLGFLEHIHQTHTLALRRYRPWYRQPCAPTHLDIVWACREAVHEVGVFAIPRFIPALAAHHQEPEHALPSAA